LTKLFRGWIPASAVAEQHTNTYRDGQCNLRQIGIADSFGKVYERSDDSTAVATASAMCKSAS
jgi:hypothetical protein